MFTRRCCRARAETRLLVRSVASSTGLAGRQILLVPRLLSHDLPKKNRDKAHNTLVKINHSSTGNDTKNKTKYVWNKLKDSDGIYSPGSMLWSSSIVPAGQNKYSDSEKQMSERWSALSENTGLLVDMIRNRLLA